MFEVRTKNPGQQYSVPFEGQKTIKFKRIELHTDKKNIKNMDLR